MKLYSDILKGVEMESTEIPIVTAQGISLAFDKYDINLMPGAAIKPDGNCAIELAKDQMKRFVYGVMPIEEETVGFFGAP